VPSGQAPRQIVPDSREPRLDELRNCRLAGSDCGNVGRSLAPGDNLIEQALHIIAGQARDRRFAKPGENHPIKIFALEPQCALSLRASIRPMSSWDPESPIKR